MEATEILIQVKEEIQDLKRILLQTTSSASVSQKWIPRTQVKEFLQYGDTQMCAFEKSGNIVVSRIGRRKFILRESLEKFLNENSHKG